MSLPFLKGTASIAIRKARIARGGEKTKAARKAVQKVAEFHAFDNAAKGRTHRPSVARLGVSL